jgi:hypothetical protein
VPNIDPVARFWIGIVVTLAVAISGGTLNLTHAVPQEYIPYVTAWCSIIAFLGSAVLTTLNGMATGTQSRIASAASLPEVKSIVTTQTLADATPSDKVVGPKQQVLNEHL